MRNTPPTLLKIANTLLAAVILAAGLSAQSNDQNFPTPVRTSEISGIIKARDVGDSRLTSHFYTFEGGQGDLFINVQTTNFSGDVDVFVVPGLRPLTKMVMYADAASSETGRVVYLRKPETMLLRIEGRTPGDEAATYRIKFAGNFLASKASDNVPEVPKVSTDTQSGVRVNSVGTIIEVIPKATPEARERTGTETPERTANADRPSEEEKAAEIEKKSTEPLVEAAPPKQEVVVTDALAETAKAKKPSRRTNRRRNDRQAERTLEEKPAETAVADPSSDDPEASERKLTAATRRAAKTKVEKTSEPDPMQNVRLVIRFKNGGVIERPMTEVTRFAVERATLTVISKNGTTGRYPMIDVASVSIE